MSYVVQSRRSIRAQNQLLKMVSDANAAGASRCRQVQKRAGRTWSNLAEFRTQIHK